MIAQQSRDAKLLARFRAGQTLQQIADEFGISRQRVHVILRRQYPKGLRRLRAIRRKAKLPGLTIAESASMAGVTCGLVKMLCAEGSLQLAACDAGQFLHPDSLATLRRWRPIATAAKLLHMGQQSLKQLCWKGRVPHAVLAGRWHLPPESIAFVRRFPPAFGMDGKLVAERMMREAARLDPQCAARQRRYRRRHA